MVTQPDTSSEARIPLSKERVMRAAIELADAEGIDSLTMRNLAHRLGVEAMSLYYHVANKDALIDGVVDEVLREIEQELGGFDVVPSAAGWKEQMRSRILTARRVMLRHKWAPAVIETRTSMTPTLLRYMDTVLGIMIAGGFSYDLGHHAMHALGSRSLGFNQELFQPDDPNEADEESSAMLADLAPQLPHIVKMLSQITHEGPDTTLGWCDDQTEFEFGLDLMLNGLESRRLG